MRAIRIVERTEIGSGGPCPGRLQRGRLGASRGVAIEHVRIILVDVSRLTGELVERAVARTEDMSVVGRAESLDELHEVALDTDSDVAIVGLHDRVLPSVCLDLLLERPRMKLLAIEERAGQAWLYELRPEQVEIGEVSPDEVVETIRAAILRPAPF